MENKDQNNTSVGYGVDADTSLSSDGIHLPPADVNSLSSEPVEQAPFTQELPQARGNVFLRFARRLDVILGVLLVIGLAIAGYMFANRSQGPVNSESLKDSYGTISIPLEELVAGKDLTVSGASSVTINGPLQLTNSFSLTPSLQPTGAKAGQIYYDETNNQLAYFNGTNFVFLTSPTPASGGLQSIGGATGQLTLGSGLNLSANQLSNSGVLSVQGQNGDVTFTAGPGLVINGTTFSNSGVISLAAGSPNVTVNSDGNGNLTLSVTEPTTGTGTVTSSGSVSAGTIPLFTSSQNIEGSIISQSGFTVTISGDLSVVTGGLSLSNALTVPNGGTGAASLAANGILVGQGTAAITSVTAGGAGLCLLSTAGAPTWAACPTGSGVTSLNGLTGGLNIANASAAGSTITIDDASTTTKGIASFNGTNFSASGGAVNTIQDINSTATPTFAGVNTNNITPNAALTVGVSAQTALLQGSVTTITSNGAGNDIILDSANAIDLMDNTFVSGDITTSGNIAVNGGNITSTGALNVTPGGALTLGSSSQALTLQGGATTSMRATSGANTTIVAFTNPVANTTLNFPALSAGAYTICTSSGNCAGAGVTLQAAYSNSSTPEITLDATRGALTIRDNSTPIGGNLFEVQNNAGSATYLAVTATGATVTGTISSTGDINSTGGSLQTSSTTRIDNSGNLVNIASLTASGNASLQGGNITLGTNAQAGAIVINDGSSNTGTLQVAALGQNTVYVLPDPGSGSATICLTTGNCAGTGGGVTTSGGTTNRLAKFTAGQAIGDSSITDNGATVTTSGNIVIQGGSATIGVAGSQSGTLFLAYGGGAFTGSVATDTLTANQNYLLPNASGTFCLTSGNCAGVGGTGDILQGGNNFGTALTLGTNDNFAFNLETNGTTRMTIANDGSQITFGANLDLILQGATAYISNSQAQTNSEAFGLNATTTGGNAVAVGNGATSVASGVSVGHNAGVSAGAFGGPVSIGDGANAGAWGVAIGQNSLGTGNDGVAIGNGAGTGQAAVAIGSGSSAALNGVALGEGAVTGGNNRIVIGHAATATADNQLVIGSDATYIDNAYIGNGVTSATPIDTTLHATGGSGTDVGGADLNLAAGAGTGSAAGGNLNFQVATPGTSGSAANVPATVASLNGTTGAALFKNLVNSVNAFQVQTAGGAAVLTVDTTTNGTVLAGDLAVNGGDLTSTGALNITPGGTLTVGVTGQQLILQGSANTRLTATGGGFTTTVAFTGAPTGNTTYNFDRAAAAGTYTICTSIGNCASAGGGVTTTGGTTGAIAKFTGAQTLADSLLSESGSVITVNGNLNLTSGHQFTVNGTQISSADLSNDANLAKLSASQTFTGNTVAFQNGTNSTNAFNIQNAAGNRVVTVDTTNGRLTLGTASALSGTLVFNNLSNANTVTVTPGTLTGNRTLTLPDASGIICTDSGNCAGAGATLQTSYNFSVGGTTPKIKVNSTLLGVDIQDADTTIGANLFNVRASNAAGLGSVLFGVGSTGDVTLQNSVNSTTAFRLLTAGGTTVLTGDTTNGQIALGQSGTLSGSLVFRNATNANTTTIALTVPSSNRTITLPNATGTICLSSGNCSGAGSSNTLQAAYDAGNTITTTDARDVTFTMADTTTDGNFVVNLQCTVSCGSNGRFAIQNSGTDVFKIVPASGAATFQNISDSDSAFLVNNATGTSVLRVDTSNQKVAIGLSSGAIPAKLYVTTGATVSLRVRQNGANDVLQLATSSSDVVTVSSIGAALFKNSTDSINAFQIQPSGSTTALFNADTTNGRVGIGGVASFSKFEVIGGDAAIYNSGANPRLILGDSTSAGQNGYLQWDSTNDYFRIESVGTNGLKINDNFVTIGNIFPDQPLKVASGTTLLHQISTTGAALFRNSSNSSSAFQVQRADSTTLLNVDTSSNITTLAGDLVVTGIQPASVATNGTLGTSHSITAAKGGNTTGTTGQTGGNGGNIYLTAGSGGNAPSGSTNGWGGSVVIDGGVAGSGAGSIGLRGNVILQSGGGVVGIGTVSPNFNYRLDAAGDINISTGSAYRINGTSICTSSGCVPAAGSANYIQNQIASAQTSSNFWISGTGIANILQAGTFDTPSGTTTLGIGTTNATAINLNQNTTIANNKTFTVQGNALFKPATDSATAFKVQSAAGLNMISVNTSTAHVIIGEDAAFNGADARLYFGDDTNVSNPWIGESATGGDTDIIQVQGKNGLYLSVGASTPVVTLGATGAATFQATADNANALQVKDASGNQLLNINTASNKITLNGGVGSDLSDWVSTTSMANSFSFGAATIANGYIYTFGGYGAGWQNTVQYAPIKADGSVGSWTTGTALPTTVGYTITSVANYNGYVYIVGGSDGATDTSIVYFARLNADGSIGAWNTTTSIPVARSAVAVTIANGYMYALGGTSGSPTTATYYIKIGAEGKLDTAWTSGTALPAAIAHGAAVAANGYIYYVGGNDGTNNITNVRYATLNPLTGAIGGTWSSANSLPAATSSANAVAYNGYLYAINGGNAAVYAASLSTTGALGSWVTTSLPATKSGGSGLMHNGYFYLLGGFSGSGSTSAYYGTGPRTYVNGSLDLIGLSDGYTNNENSQGGTLTAGNTTVVGTLQVQSQASFAQNLAVAGNISIGSDSSTTTDNVLTVHSAGRAGIVLRGDSTNAGGEPGGNYINFTIDSGGTKSSLGQIQAADVGPDGSAYTGALTNATLLGTVTNQQLQFGTDATVKMTIMNSTTAHVCVNVTTCTKTFGVSGTIAASSTITASTTPDIAETIAAASDVEAADVVMADPNNTERVVKSDRAYQSAVVGVISDGTSSFMINSYGGNSGDLTGKPMVLAGRVPVKITDEGGTVKPGDYLTSSSTPGYAMKATHAGPTIGKALGYFSGDQGTVLALINVSWYDPSSGLQGDAGNFTSLNVSGNATIDGDLTVTGMVTASELRVNGHIIVGGGQPQIETLTSAGQGASVTVSGTDAAGTITVTVGASATADALAKVIFDNAYAISPEVVLTPVGKASALIQPYVDQTDTNSFTIGVGNDPQAGTTYRFNYHVLGAGQ